VDTTDGDGVATPSPPSVQLSGITKRFGAVVACDRVDLALAPGEVHGLLGENGAGKSTLAKLLIGLLLPDDGEILVGGVPRRIQDPVAAAGLGIGMVHQHLSLVEALTVWENVVLGERAALDRATAVADVARIGERYGLDVDPYARVGDLSVATRQRVEIVKCLRREPRVVILDEPTSVLTPVESRELFGVLRSVVQDERRTVVLISHKLEEVLRATDVVTIMRAGRVVASMRTAGADARTLARAMVGREVALRSDAAAVGLLHELPALVAAEVEATAVEAAAVEAAAVGGTAVGGTASRAVLEPDRPPALVVRGAVVRGRDGAALLDGLTLEVRTGEIVGVAGVEGNGQRALGDLPSSLVGLEAGTVEVAGRAVRAGRHGAMARAGVGVIPEDRHASGCVLEMSVAENLVLDEPRSVARGAFLDRGRMRRHAQALIDEFEILTPSPDAPMWSLSGGNQQRVVLARELHRSPVVLVAAQPTRGLDVGAIEYMGRRLRDAARNRGVGVLLVSSELEEIIDLSDRVLVIHRGRIVGEMARGAVDLERLGLLMGGAAA
jgi:simple sugar transport system ATP-binding protein